jgi:hypothetical protein
MSSSPSPLSRPRLWAARLALLVACAGSVATSPTLPWVTTEHQGAPLTLRTESPTVTRHLRVRLSTRKQPAQPINLGLEAAVTATWRPDSPTSSLSLKPRLRARLVLPPGSASSPDWTEPSEFNRSGSGLPEEQARLYPSAQSFGECTLAQECEWSIALELELQPQGAVGAVDVNWTFQANVGIVDSTEPPEDIDVEISEE